MTSKQAEHLSRDALREQGQVVTPVVRCTHTDPKLIPGRRTLLETMSPNLVPNSANLTPSGQS